MIYWLLLPSYVITVNCSEQSYYAMDICQTKLLCLSFLCNCYKRTWFRNFTIWKPANVMKKTQVYCKPEYYMLQVTLGCPSGLCDWCSWRVWLNLYCIPHVMWLISCIRQWIHIFIHMISRVNLYIDDIYHKVIVLNISCVALGRSL